MKFIISCYLYMLHLQRYSKSYIFRGWHYLRYYSQYSLKCHFKTIVGSTSYILVYNVLISFLFGRMIWLLWWLKLCLMICNSMYNAGLLGIKHISICLTRILHLILILSCNMFSQQFNCLTPHVASITYQKMDTCFKIMFQTIFRWKHLLTLLTLNFTITATGVSL